MFDMPFQWLRPPCPYAESVEGSLLGHPDGPHLKGSRYLLWSSQILARLWLYRFAVTRLYQKLGTNSVRDLGILRKKIRKPERHRGDLMLF